MFEDHSRGRRRLIAGIGGLSLFALGGVGLWARDRQGRRLYERVDYQAIEVDVDSDINERLESIAETLRLELGRAGLRPINLSVEDLKIVVSLERGDQVEDVLENFLETWPEITLSKINGQIEAYFAQEALNQIRNDIFQQTLNVVRARLEDHGISRHAIRIGGDRCILIPRQEYERAKSSRLYLISRANLSFRMVDKTIDSATSDVPAGVQILPWIKSLLGPRPSPMPVRRRVFASGEHVADAQVEIEDGRPVIVLRFDVFTRKRVQHLMRTLVGDELIAVVLDGQIVATLAGRDLRFNRTVIRGTFTRTQAEKLAFLLSAFAIPAPLREVDTCPDL